MSAHVINRYRLKPGANLVEMPPGARLLHVGSQGGRAYVWALLTLPIEPAANVQRKILVAPTDREFTVDEGPFDYVGAFTIIDHDPDPALSTSLVFHVFDFGERPLSSEKSS